MAYSINTNITSLQAQEYLRTTSEFQGKTINRVTSGLRIISSGDDAAGLAIANGFRSDRAVLTQGVRNANDGLSTLQTIDGGMNNISMLLDRARTLAAQSASGTFNGDRNLLNSEFQSVVTEIDRQSRAIGLDTGGTFAKSLSVFIGGGRVHDGEATSAAITNGSVGVDLSNSVVDARTLGLKGFQAAGVAGTDIGTGSASTSVQAILADTTNQGSEAVSGYTDFYFSGAGFAGANKIKVSVNLAGVTDTSTLTTAINSAISAAGAGTTSAATAFKNAGIVASVNTDVNGKKQLTFSSNSAAFQVRSGDLMSNALMGNYTSSSNPTGKSMTVTYEGGTVSGATNATWTNNSTIRVRFQGGGMASPVDLTLGAITGGGGGTAVSTVLADLSSQVVNNATLKAAGITVDGTQFAAAGKLKFKNTRGEAFEVQMSGDTENRLGFGSWDTNSGASNAFEYTSIAGSAAMTPGVAGGAKSLEFVVGGQKTTLTVTMGATDTTATALQKIQAAISADSLLTAAGIQATTPGNVLTFTSSNSSYFRVSELLSAASDADFKLNNAGVASGTDTATVLSTSNAFNSGGVTQSAFGSNADVIRFSQIKYGDDDQTVTITAVDSAGAEHRTAIVIKKDDLATAAGSSGRTLDEAINYINSQLQQTNDATLQKLVAVKEVGNDHAGSPAYFEGIRFMAPATKFKVSIGSNASTTGLSEYYDSDGNGSLDATRQGVVSDSADRAGGSVADITSQGNAQSAVTLLATAVSVLGSAQAVVGKGQNNFSYAVSLAQTQLNNLAASESRIRDADLAAEAANMTKAQILQQAGIAALAQANVAPQAVLTLLRG